MQEIEELGLAENTIIAIWGDHGWHLGDQQVWGKHTIFENALKSVLIMKIPGKYKSRSVSSIVETVDIYPTLMDLCKIKLPYPMDGESFRVLLDNDKKGAENVAYGYFNNGITMRTRRYRLTKYFRKDAPQIELYDHYLDPYESKNIAMENKQIVDQLMPLLEKGDTGIYK